MNRNRPYKTTARDLTPVRSSRVLFDSTRPRKHPYFARNLAVTYTPYHRAPATIADLLWWAAQSGRVAEPVWDIDTVADARAAESLAVERLERAILS